MLILYSIFRESISNILKHSESYEIEVTIKNEDKNVVFIIIDKGIGIINVGKQVQGEARKPTCTGRVVLCCSLRAGWSSGR